MKNSIVYTLVFLALQVLAGAVVGGIWKLGMGIQDSTVMMLVVTMAVFSVLVIAVFLLAKWTEVSPRWLLTKQWGVLIWSVVAAMEW